MTDEELEGTLEWFEKYFDVTPRIMSALPRKALIGIRTEIDKNFVIKTQIKEDYIKKDVVEQKYILKTSLPSLPESKEIVCPKCNQQNKSPMYDNNNVSFEIKFCIHCGSDLNPPPTPPPPKVKAKKYIPRPLILSKSKYPPKIVPSEVGKK